MLTPAQTEAFNIGHENGKNGLYLPYNYDNERYYYDKGYEDGVEESKHEH